MTDRLALPRRYLDQLEALLSEHVPDVEVWAYGSRINGESHEGSDLDLVLRDPALEPLDGGFYDLLEEIEKSNIPILIQVHDWARLPESFHREIERDYVVVQEGKERRRAGEWREMPFSEAVLVNPPTWLNRGANYPFVDMAAVNADSRTTVSVEERTFKGSGSRFQSGDTLMARITPCLENGKIARYEAVGDKLDAHGSTEFIVIRGRPNVTDNNFAYYLTKWEEVRNYAIGQMTGTSGRQRVPADSLDHLTVPLPPLPEQEAIAHVLGTLDDKIELNRRMNETLEAMARALFKSWFVDFDPVRAKMEGRWRRGESLPGLPAEHYDLFPDRLVASELGEIPEGWEVRALGDYATLNPESWSRSNLPAEVEYVDLTNTKWGVIEITQRFRWEDAPSRAKRILRAGDTIVGTVRPGNGSYSLVGNDGLTGSTGFAVLRPIHYRYRELVYLAVTTPDNIERLAHRADGGAYPAVRPGIVSQTQVAIPTPDTDLLDRFSTIVGSILDKLESTERESRLLGARRDALLPMLVSGEVMVMGYEPPLREDSA